MSGMAVTLTIEQLRALVREEVKAAVRELEDQPNMEAPVSDDEMAEARRRWARKLRAR